MRPKAVLLALFVFVGAAWASGTALAKEGGTTPLLDRPPGAGPVEVRVGMCYVDFDAIDATNENFKAMGYLFLSWKDPRLAFDPKAEGVREKHYAAGELWSPVIEVINALEFNVLLQDGYHVSPDGTVNFPTRFNATLSSELDYARFPFDRQELQFMVEPFTAEPDQVVLVQDEARTGIEDEAFLSGWRLHGLTVESSTRRFLKTPTRFSRLTFKLAITRISHYYLLNIVLPTFLFVLLSWIVFWVDLEDVSTQLGLTLSLLLTVVAFTISIDTALPDLEYSTWMDYFQRASFVFILLSAFEVIYVHRLAKDGPKEAGLRARSWSRRLLPGGYLVVLGVLVAKIWL
ncbi:MAG: hypothetical protein HYZ53_07935 [Planctomycetes bacterium]|nr:hypothetical protein [Planctomycetota bacterium]